MYPILIQTICSWGGPGTPTEKVRGREKSWVGKELPVALCLSSFNVIFLNEGKIEFRPKVLLYFHYTILIATLSPKERQCRMSCMYCKPNEWDKKKDRWRTSNYCYITPTEELNLFICVSQSFSSEREKDANKIMNQRGKQTTRFDD